MSKVNYLEFLPRFDGTGLPLIYDFIYEFESVCNLENLATCARRHYLLQCIQGEAKDIVDTLGIAHEKEYDSLVYLLSSYFGEVNRQKRQILHLQRAVLPTIETMSREKTSKKEGFSYFREHVSILESVQSLHKLFLDKTLSEDPLNVTFINSLCQCFPRELTYKLYSEDWESQSSFERFKDLLKLCRNYKKLFWHEIIVNGVNVRDSSPAVMPMDSPDTGNQTQQGSKEHASITSHAVQTGLNGSFVRKKVRRKRRKRVRSNSVAKVTRPPLYTDYPRTSMSKIACIPAPRIEQLRQKYAKEEPLHAVQRDIFNRFAGAFSLMAQISMSGILSPNLFDGNQTGLYSMKQFYKQ